MEIKNNNFRIVTLALQIIALAAYYLPTMIAGGNFGITWLAIGVVHTIIFCAVFFRDARRRTALSIILMILVILWSIVVFGVIFIFSLMGIFYISLISPLTAYCAFSLLAIIFALAAPRRYAWKNGGWQSGETVPLFQTQS